MTLEEIFEKYAQFLKEQTNIPPLTEEEKQIVEDSYHRVNGNKTKKQNQ